MKIAVVGLGNMGGRIAKRLLQQGHEVGVYDTNTATVKEFEALGASAYGSLDALGAAHKIVLTVLPGAEIVRQVVLGAAGLASGMLPGSVLIDMTSSVPSVTKTIAAALSASGVKMLDAPVSGGVSKAENGTLTIMVGGDPATLQEVQSVLDDIGEHIVHVGDIGAGHTAKALNNLITATTLAITSEAMALGVKMGLDAQILLDVINLGSGRSAASETKFPQQVLSGKFAPGFSMALMCKDVGIAVGMAHDAALPATVSSSVYELWKYGVGKGKGDMDHSAIALIVEELAGVQIRAKS
jgi:3-hydroxyisobutyrate dehydrogenase-like beta-hydroxyacid dehydrogenase